jgi:hypothetical protein
MMLAELPLRAAAALTVHVSAPVIPNPTPDAPQEIKDKVNHLLGFLKYLGLGALIAGVMFVAMYAAVVHRRGDMHHELASRIGAIALGGVLLASATTIVGYLT